MRRVGKSNANEINKAGQTFVVGQTFIVGQTFLFDILNVHMNIDKQECLSYGCDITNNWSKILLQHV